MNLQELHESKKTKVVNRALREHYEINIDFDRLDMGKAQRMLSKTRTLIKESKLSGRNNQNNPAYLKLVMVEQALQDRISDLRSRPMRIMVENEEIQKSQVILAAQDMVDSLQKILENVSKMNVEELNAVVEGMRNEFGGPEADQFNAAVGEALAALQTAVSGTKTAVQSALSVVTGESTGMEAPAGAEMGVEPSIDQLAGMEQGTGEEVSPELEEPEPVDVTQAGRERR